MNETATGLFAVQSLTMTRAADLIALLEAQTGVHRAHASVALGRVAVDFDPALTDQDTLVRIIRGAGHQVVPDPT